MQTLALDLCDDEHSVDCKIPNQSYYTCHIVCRLPAGQEELLSWIRSDFRAKAGIPHNDEEVIKSHLKYGEKMLKELKQSVDLATAS